MLQARAKRRARAEANRFRNEHAEREVWQQSWRMGALASELELLASREQSEAAARQRQAELQADAVRIADEKLKNAAASTAASSSPRKGMGFSMPFKLW